MATSATTQQSWPPQQRADLLGLTAHVRLVGPDGGPVQLQPMPAAPEPVRLGTPSLQAALDTLPDEQLEQIVAISGRLKAALTPPPATLPGGPILDVTAHKGGDRPLPEVGRQIHGLRGPALQP